MLINLQEAKPYYDFRTTHSHDSGGRGQLHHSRGQWKNFIFNHFGILGFRSGSGLRFPQLATPCENFSARILCPLSLW